jgi:hypothetical protein
MANDIDEEWANFISSGKDDDISDDNDDIDDDDILEQLPMPVDIEGNADAPIATDIYISTKTKIAYLDSVVDLKTIFWGIPVMVYSKPENGVVKKQMKFKVI